MKDINYMVRINSSHINRDPLGDMFSKTVCRNLFCGTLVNTNGSNFYFEMGEDKALVIIPHSWIEWMAPVEEEKEENGTDSNN